MSRRLIFRSAARSTAPRMGARLAALPPRAQHAALELLRGTMDRHSFIAYRDDRERDAQPITFEGDAMARLRSGSASLDADHQGSSATRRLRRAHQSEPHLSRSCALHRRRSGAGPNRDRWRALRRRDPANPPRWTMTRAASSSGGFGSTTSSCSTPNGPEAPTARSPPAAARLRYARHAAKADMARRCVDRLGVPRGRAVAFGNSSARRGASRL